MKNFLKKNRIKLILVLIAVVLAVLSFFVGKFYKQEKYAGSYVTETTDNNSMYLEVTEIGNRYDCFIEIVSSGDIDSYVSYEFSIDKSEIEYGKELTRITDSTEYGNVEVSFIFLENCVIVNNKRTFDTDYNYSYTFLLKKTHYVDTDKEEKLIVTVLRLAAVILFSAGIVTMLVRKKSRYLIIFLAIYLCLALTVFFAGYLFNSLSGTYVITGYKNSVRMYEYEISVQKEGKDNYFLVCEEKYNLRNIFSSYVHPESEVFIIPVEKKGNKFVISGDYSDRLELNAKYDEIIFKTGALKPRFTLISSKGRQNIDIKKINSNPVMIIISISVVSLIFVSVLVLFIIKYHREKKIKAAEPLIGDGIYVCGEILYRNPELEDFLNYAIRIYERKKMVINGSFVSVFDKTYNNVQFDKTDINLSGIVADKSFKNAETIKISHDDGIFYFVKYKKGNALITTMMDKFLLMIKLEVDNEA